MFEYNTSLSAASNKQRVIVSKATICIRCIYKNACVQSSSSVVLQNTLVHTFKNIFKQKIVYVKR